MQENPNFYTFVDGEDCRVKYWNKLETRLDLVRLIIIAPPVVGLPLVTKTL